ncbi:MAG: hypothetical protein LBD35_06575 [Prevotellaceae bacterium]|nr:hypothetical protein [Prevotellaceae bacterium]
MKKSSGRKVEVNNFSNAKSMAVITPFKFDPENNALMRLKKIAKDNRIEFKLLVYYQQGKLPDNVIPDPGKILFSDRECNWFGKPTIPEVQDFINLKLDILIDLTSEKCFVTQYIATASSAKFKVGRFAYGDNPYDFMVTSDYSMSDEKFVQALESYLAKFQGSK